MKGKRLLQILFLCLVLTLLTVTALAAGDGTKDNPFTTVDDYNNAVAGSDWDGEDIYLTIDGENFYDGDFALRNVQNRVNPPRLHLTLTGCRFYGNTSGDPTNSSFMYLSNCQELVIDQCSFDTDDQSLRYGINWNLIQIQNATVKISNSSFQGSYLENALKLNQRNGPDDTALDVKGGGTWSVDEIIPATIAHAEIDNCNFFGAGASDEPPIFMLGSAGKNDGAAAPSTGAFPMTITMGSHRINVFLAYNASEEEAEKSLADPQYALESGLGVRLLGIGNVYKKTAQGDLIGGAPAATIDGVEYASLQNALRAAQDGDTIVLESYVYLTRGIDVDKNVTLDLNGCTISNDETWNGGDYLVAVKRGGDLTVTDSSDPSAGGITTDNPDIYAAVKMTILGEAEQGDPALLIVEGGTLQGYYYGISGNGTRHNTLVDIDGGTITAFSRDEGVAIFQPQFGDLLVHSGTITANTAIEIRAGYLNVYDGAVIQGGTGTPVVTPNGSGSTTTNTGIAVAQHTTEWQIDVEISGGQISGGAALYESNPQGNDGSSSVIINIEGDAALTGDLISSGFGETTVTGGQIDGDVTYSGTGQLLLQENAKVTGGVVNDGATGALAILDSTVAGAVTGDANIVNSSVNGVPTTNVSEDAVARVGAKFYDSLNAAVTAPESLNQTVYLLQSAELTVEPDSIGSLDVLPGAVLTAKDPTLMTTFVNIATGGGLVMPNSEGALETFLGSGDDARVRLTQGYVTVNLDWPLLSLNEDSTAEIPAGRELVVPAGIDAAIEPGATLTVRGKLTVANGGSLEIWEDGRLDVASGGILRVNSQAAVTGIHDSSVGEITSGGTIALMEGGEHKAAVSVPITLTSGGAVYSQFDAKDLTIESAEAATLDPAEKVEGVANATEIAEGQEPVFGYRYTYKSSGDGDGDTGDGDTGSGTVIGGGSSITSYAITVEQADHGTVTASSSRASRGTRVTVTVRPEDGYVLDSLTVRDASGASVTLTTASENTYTFSMPASAVTVTAAFTQEEGTGLPFTDVDADDWYYDAVQYAFDAGWMTGTGDATFSPDSQMTRAMLVTILWRMEENPAVNYAMAFTDVEGGQWYTEAIRWAASEGIVNGLSDTAFGPGTAMTREQMVSILYRYAQYKGYDVSIGEDTNILSYLDFQEVNEYAVPAFQWACGSGVVNGTTESTLAPQGTATRAHVATILMRFQEDVAK